MGVGRIPLERVKEVMRAVHPSIRPDLWEKIEYGWDDEQKRYTKYYVQIEHGKLIAGLKSQGLTQDEAQRVIHRCQQDALDSMPCTDGRVIYSYTEKFQDFLNEQTVESNRIGESVKPHWNPEKRELRLGNNGPLVKRYRAIAENVIVVLEAFQKSDWKHSITDPNWGKHTTDAQSYGSPEKFGTIRRLNQNAEGMYFFGPDEMKEIAWDIGEKTSKRKSPKRRKGRK